MGIREFYRGRLEAAIRKREQPWSPADLEASAIVVSPHQDDETLGCGGTIALKRRAGAAVRVLFLTDGARSHEERRSPEEMAAIRHDEAVAACSVLGVPAHDLDFLGFRDRSLGENSCAAVEALAAVLRRARPAQVFLPYRREGTSDHDAANTITRRAIGMAGIRPDLFEYPVWFYHRWPWTPGKRGRTQALKDAALWTYAISRRFRRIVPVASVLGEKRRALSVYHSQVDRPEGDPDWPILSDVAGGEWVERLLCDFEMFSRPRFRAVAPSG